VLLRPATLHDLPALHAIEASATEVYYDAGFSRTHVCPRSDPELRQLLKYTCVLVACVDEHPVGYASYYTRGPFLHLEEVAVERDHQRRGIGIALARQVLAAAEADPQCTHLSLVAYRRAPWAIELYTRLGFHFLDPGNAPPRAELLQEIVDIEAAAAHADPNACECRVAMLRPVAR
jgi:ribosomal protein S18 acetylase RimI-like enzyme